MFKKANVFCFLAMLFYSAEASVADMKLSNLSSRLLTLYYSGGILLLSLIALIWTDKKEGWQPTRAQYGFIGLMVALSFLASLAHFGALSQAGAVKLSLFYCLMPVFCTIFVAIFKGQWPSWRLMIAWALAGGAIYLVSSSEQVPKT